MKLSLRSLLIVTAVASLQAYPALAENDTQLCGTGQITSMAYSLFDQGNKLNLGFTMTNQPGFPKDYYKFNNVNYLVLRYSDPNRFPVASEMLRRAFLDRLPVKVLAKNNNSVGCLQDDQSFIIQVCAQASDSACR